MAELAVPPAHLWIPPRTGSYGDEAVDLMALAGRELDAEQQQSVDAQLSYGPGGRWAAFETARIEPRQNGKTGGELLACTFFDLFLMPPDKITWTAHLFPTARAAFADAVALIDGCSYLSRRVKKITYANGEESIALLTGAVLQFLARSKGGGRGLGGKRVVLDEALFLSAEAMGALIPTLAARSMTGDPQVNYASSAGVRSSDHLRTIRDRGRRGGDPSLVYVEHCAPGSWDDPGCSLGPECPHVVGTDGCALDDEHLARLANHALGRRISLDYVRNERRALPPEEYGRERFGWWDDPVDTTVVPLQDWADCKDTESAPAGRPVLAVDSSPGSRSASIVAAIRRPDGLAHLEVVAHERGTDWLAARCRELAVRQRPAAWVIDPGGPAGSLLPELRAAGLELTEMTTRDLGQACEAFAAAVTDHQVRHLADPLLGRAIAGAGRREIGDGLWAWSRRKSEVDISPLVAATEALWGLATLPDQPTPPPPPALARSSSPATRPGAGDVHRVGF